MMMIPHLTYISKNRDIRAEASTCRKYIIKLCVTPLTVIMNLPRGDRIDPHLMVLCCRQLDRDVEGQYFFFVAFLLSNTQTGRAMI